MGKLNKAKNIQIAAMNAKGMTIEAIVKASGVDKNTVKESLEQRGRKYTELGVMSDEQIRAYIVNLQRKGKSTAEIGELTGLGTKKVCEFIFEKDGASQEALTAETLTEDISAMNRTELKAYAVRLFHEGKNRKEIIELTGLSRSAVYALLPAAKGERKGQGAGRPKKKHSQINEDFDKAVDEMIKQNKQEADALTGQEEVIRTQNELRQEAGLTPIKVEEGQMCPEWLLATAEDMLFIYNAMTEAEQRAWDLGQIYGRIAHERAKYV